MNLLFVVALILVLALVTRSIREHFNDRPAKIALYDHPSRCPFDYIRLYEDRQHNNKFVVESKIEQQPKSLDLVFDTIDDYQDAWNQIKHVFPNITKCGQPYETYINQIRQYYQNQKYALPAQETTVPLYDRETFTSNTKVELPSIYVNHNINVRQLSRTTDNPSQMSSAQYMKPNTPNMRGHEQIDTSVTPPNDLVPITYTDKNIQMLKNQMVDSNFDQQRTYQKQILQSKAEIDQLRREIESLRDQLVYEKSHFENLDKTIEEKHQKIVDTTRLNIDLLKKIDDLNHRNSDLENLYLQADAHKNTLEVRLKTIRNSVEEEIKHKGYTILPPTHWTMNQWRPPICRDQNNIQPHPVVSKNTSGYAAVFGETEVKNTDLYMHQETPMDLGETPSPMTPSATPPSPHHTSP